MITRAMVHRVMMAGLATATIAASLAACSSSSEGGGSSGGSTAAGGSTGGSSAAGPSGTPFVGLQISSPLLSADYSAGISAATQAINAAGGVDGHPIKIETCSDNNDPNQASSCAQKAIGDTSVLALVDDISNYGDTYGPEVDAAKIPSIGLLMGSAGDQTSPMSFPLFGGTFNVITSAGAVAKMGAKRVGVPYLGVPAGAQLPPFISQVIKPFGATVVGSQAIPVTTTDVTSFAAEEIAAKPDYVVSALTTDLYTEFIKSVRQQGGSDLKFLISSGVFDPAAIKSVFGDDKNLTFVNEYDHSAPGYAHFLADMKKYNNGYANRNDSVLSGWVGVYAFANALKAIVSSGTASPTRASLVSYLNAQTNFDVEGLTNGIDYSKPSTALGGTVPRLFTDRIWLATYDNGSETPIGGAFSLFTPPAK